MARIGGENSDQIDPLAHYSSLSLFPRSFTSHSNPNVFTAGSLNSHLKSKVLSSPENLLKQAKTVLNDSLNLFKNDKTYAVASEDKVDAIFVTNEKKHQVKRPALGLKQAKFSAKPVPRQLDTVTEPSIDINELENPQKYFEAYERMENAKKEMQKLRGEPLGQLDQNLSFLSPRRKRPSLMGKSAAYKHQSYTSTTPDVNNKTLLSSEETFVNHAVSPVHLDVQSETETEDVILPNTKVHDFTTSETWKDGDLNKLLSSDYDGLDEAEVVNLLHEKLDVKVQNFDKLSISDLCDVRPHKSVFSTEAFSNITDSTSHLNGIMKARHGVLLATGRQSNESNVKLSKSPLASISLLNRHISKLAPSVDPFSVTDIDSSPDKSSSGMHNDKQGDGKMEMYGSHRSVHAEESSVVDRHVLEANDISSSSQAEDQLAEVGRSGQDGTTELLQDIRKPEVQIEESNAGCGSQSPFSVKKRGASIIGQPGRMERREDLCEIVRSPEHFNDKDADSSLDLVHFSARGEVPTSEDKEKENEMVKDVDSVSPKHNIIEKFTLSEVEGCELGEASITEDILCKEPTKKTRAIKRKVREKKSKVSSQVLPANEAVNEETEADTPSNAIAPTEPPNKRRKPIGDAPATRKKNENRRSSLHGVAGTNWDAGIRRSTRIRMRPLEYWKGERFIYGRVHDSLVTVIGVKYASPSKDAGQPRIKVKSFVSDELKDKVEDAALY